MPRRSVLGPSKLLRAPWASLARLARWLGVELPEHEQHARRWKRADTCPNCRGTLVRAVLATTR